MQGQTRQISVETSITGTKVVFFDAMGNTKAYGITPFVAQLEVDSTYSYKLRHPDFRPDSGEVHIDGVMNELVIPIRPCQVEVHWDVVPADAQFNFKKLKGEKLRFEGVTMGDTIIPSGKYRLTLQRDDYRTYSRKVKFKSDTTITISRQLQYCRVHWVVALNVGLAPEHSTPLGLLVSCGGVHGAYVRYQQTFFDQADSYAINNKDLDRLVDFPYSDPKTEYCSMVVGYQYLTPIGVCLQVGAGTAKHSANWKSKTDNKRHVYTPDNGKGAVYDLGLGYAVRKMYVGASLQILPEWGKSPSSMAINLGVHL